MTETKETEVKEVVLVENQLRKIIHAEGSGDLPQKGQEIFALYRGTLEDKTVFDENQDRDEPFKFVLGKGNVIKGWDQGFASMRKGEKATLICSPDYAYGAKGSPPKIPPNSTLHFEVELLDFKDKKKEKWEMDDAQKIKLATELKNKGNEQLKASNFKQAVADYKEGIEYVDYETAEEAKQILKILRLNISQAYLKTHQYSAAIENCGKVLKDDSINVKALFRRGLAYSRNHDFELAKNDFKQLLKHDPQNGEAKHELAHISVAIKQQKQKQKKVFGSLFSKGGLYEDKKIEPPKKVSAAPEHITSSDEDVRQIEKDEDNKPTEEMKDEKVSSAEEKKDQKCEPPVEKMKDEKCEQVTPVEEMKDEKEEKRVETAEQQPSNQAKQ